MNLMISEKIYTSFRVEIDLAFDIISISQYCRVDSQRGHFLKIVLQFLNAFITIMKIQSTIR